VASLFSGCSRDVEIDHNDMVLVDRIVKDSGIKDLIHPGEQVEMKIGNFAYVATVQAGDTGWSITRQALDDFRSVFNIEDKAERRTWYSYILQVLLAVFVIRVFSLFYLLWFNIRARKKGRESLSFRKFWSHLPSRKGESDRRFSWRIAKNILRIPGFVLVFVALFYFRTGFDVLISIIFSVEVVLRITNALFRKEQ
jgi:hypothetical protein